MDGNDYVATVRLSTLADDTLAEPGESCARVDPASLPWLLEQGLIAPAPAPKARGRKTTAPEPPAESEA